VPGGAIDKRETELALELLELSLERRLRKAPVTQHARARQPV
jgi:hypothetical protein